MDLVRLKEKKGKQDTFFLFKKIPLIRKETTVYFYKTSGGSSFRKNTQPKFFLSTVIRVSRVRQFSEETLFERTLNPNFSRAVWKLRTVETRVLENTAGERKLKNEESSKRNATRDREERNSSSLRRYSRNATRTRHFNINSCVMFRTYAARSLVRTYVRGWEKKSRRDDVSASVTLKVTINSNKRSTRDFAR